MMTPDLRQSFGASSLTTIMQMVANGYGVTLLPEMAAAIELHPSDHIRLLRFAEPEPEREIGLAWRKSSPRKSEFEQLGELLRDVGPVSYTHLTLPTTRQRCRSRGAPDD